MRNSVVRMREAFPRIYTDSSSSSSSSSSDDPPPLPANLSLPLRRSKYGSPRASTLSRTDSFNSLAESQIEKHAAEIDSLLSSDDELRVLTGDLRGSLQEKQETSDLTRRPPRIKTRTSLPSQGMKTINSNALDMELEEGLDSATKMTISLGNNMGLERSNSRGSLCAQYESEIKKLRKQLEIEHRISAIFKLKMQEKQNLSELFKKELHETKMEKERTSSEMLELQKESERKASEIEQLKEELNRERNTDGLEKFLESMKASIEVFQKDNVDHKEKEVMAQETYSEKAHDDTLEKDDAAIKELLRLLKQFLDEELEKSYEEDERSRTINGLQANCEFQKAHMSKLAEALNEELKKQEELRTTTTSEFQKTNEIIVGLDEKLVDCMNTLKAKGGELLNIQAALTELHIEREAKERLKSEIGTTKEELTKTTELLKTANSELEISKKENQEIAERLSNSERMLEECTNKIQELDEDNSKLHLALEQSMKRINSMATDSENYVDRRIVTKLLITYFQRNYSQEVLDLMMRLLGFSEEDTIKIGSALQAAGRTGVHSILNITGRLVSGMLGSTSPELSSKELCPSQSISELWIDFLLKDAEQKEKRESHEVNNTPKNSDLTMASPKGPAETGEESATTPLLPLASSATNNKPPFLDCF